MYPDGDFPLLCAVYDFDFQTTLGPAVRRKTVVSEKNISSVRRGDPGPHSAIFFANYVISVIDILCYFRFEIDQSLFPVADVTVTTISQLTHWLRLPELLIHVHY